MFEYHLCSTWWSTNTVFVSTTIDLWLDPYQMKVVFFVSGFFLFLNLWWFMLTIKLRLVWLVILLFYLNAGTDWKIEIWPAKGPVCKSTKLWRVLVGCCLDYRKYDWFTYVVELSIFSYSSNNILYSIYQYAILYIDCLSIRFVMDPTHCLLSLLLNCAFIFQLFCNSG